MDSDHKCEVCEKPLEDGHPASNIFDHLDNPLFDHLDNPFFAFIRCGLCASCLLEDAREYLFDQRLREVDIRLRKGSKVPPTVELMDEAGKVILSTTFMVDPRVMRRLRAAGLQPASRGRFDIYTKDLSTFICTVSG